jgi:anti-sigma B factor antagonist
MNTALSLELSRPADGRRVLRVAGEVDRSNSAELAAAVEAGLDTGPGGDGEAGGAAGPLTVDLSGVGYLDSAGLSVLFEYVGEIELVVPPLLAPVLEVSGLSGLATVRAAGEPAEEGSDRAGRG